MFQADRNAITSVATRPIQRDRRIWCSLPISRPNDNASTITTTNKPTSRCVMPIRIVDPTTDSWVSPNRVANCATVLRSRNSSIRNIRLATTRPVTTV